MSFRHDDVTRRMIRCNRLGVFKPLYRQRDLGNGLLIIPSQGWYMIFVHIFWSKMEKEAIDLESGKVGVVHRNSFSTR